MFDADVTPDLAKKIQALIDLTIEYGQKNIIVLSWENTAPNHANWKFSSFAQQKKSSAFFNLKSSQKGAYLIHLAKLDDYQSRSKSQFSLPEFIDKVLNDYSRHIIYPADIEWSSTLDIHQKIFYRFASRAEIVDYVDQQNKLIADLNEKLLRGYVQDYFNGRKLASGLHDLSEEYGIGSEKRLIDYINRNKSYFKSRQDPQNILYAPEFGYAVGSDLTKVRQIVSDIHTVNNPFKDLKKIASSHGLEERNVVLFIYNNQRLFEDVKRVQPLFSMMKRAEQELQSPTSFVLTQQDMGGVLSHYLRTEFQIDINPTPLLRYFQWGLSEEKGREYSEALKAKREGQKPRVPFAVIDPSRVEQSNNLGAYISEIFTQETRRPARGERRENGGRAGFGPQLPNLWSPKEP